jgi:hypothetical protein
MNARRRVASVGAVTPATCGKLLAPANGIDFGMDPDFVSPHTSATA